MIPARRQKPHELTDQELSKLIALTKKILKAAKARNIVMSKRQARKHAIAHLGFVDFKDFEQEQREFGAERKFSDGIKSAMPRYREL